jgi:hypothetical protein
VTRFPVRLVLKPLNDQGEVGDPAFTWLWGQADWDMPHEPSGQITFQNLMSIQVWRIEYEAVVIRRQVELLEDMERLARDLGGTSYDLSGKKVGEVPSHGFHFWNANVNVTQEIGKTQGYADDSKGRTEMYSDLYRSKAGNGVVVVRAPDGWLHIYALDMQLRTMIDMGEPDEDGFNWVLSAGAQVPAANVVQLLGSDGSEYVAAGKGWKTQGDKNRLTTLDQFAIGAIFGDFFDEPSVDAAVGQIVIGCIPIVGQIADARDVAAGIAKMWSTGGKDGKLQTAMALVGIVPLFGDAIKAARGAGRKAVGEAAQKAIPQAQQGLAGALRRGAADVAQRFGVVRQAFPELGETLARALKETTAETAEELATAVRKALDTVGGDAGAVVRAAGGKWSDLAKGLNRSPAGKAIGEQMSAWREVQLATMESALKEAKGSIGQQAGRQLDAPNFERTGTKAFTSDIDISFVGPDSSIYAQQARAHMASRYGMAYEDVQKMLDLDIFTDPSRLYSFQKGLAEGAAKKIEARLARESEVNVLAKMLENGVPEERVRHLAEQMGVKGNDFRQVVDRAKELKEIGADPARRAKMELDLDALHRKMLEAPEGSPQRAALAEQLAISQSRLNAATPGAYLTPGGVAANVGIRDNVAAARAWSQMTPAMRSMAVMDDLAMLEIVVAKASHGGWSPKLVKDWIKYTDRMIVRAGQVGATDIGAASAAKALRARQLFDDVSGLLQGARTIPAELGTKAARQIDEARGLLKSQLDEMIQRAHAASDPLDGLKRMLVTLSQAARPTRIVLDEADKSQGGQPAAAGATP